MPDSKSVVANGMIGRKVGMVRLSLGTPSRQTALSTELTNRFPHAARAMES